MDMLASILNTFDKHKENTEALVQSSKYLGVLAGSNWKFTVLTLV